MLRTGRWGTVRILGPLVAVAALLATVVSPAQAAPAPSPAPAVAPDVARPAAPVARTVAWDADSIMVDGRRMVVWSGEFHPFRLPSPDLWRDILQKMRSHGFTAVSIYINWAYHSTAPGVYDWTGIRDLDAFLDVAQEVGIYVIARPGPYINAEVDAGGYPGWLTTKKGRARTDAPEYLKYSDEYMTEVDSIIARRQVTNGGGPVILYQIENENASFTNTQGGRDYMAHLYAKARADGITVPIFHNDKGRNGFWVPGSFATPASENPPNYLYGFDGYPAGVCSSGGNPGTPGPPPDWGFYGIGGARGGASASPTTPGLLAEFGGGWFDPWGGKLMGGKGYPCMRERQNAAMERQYYLTNLANGIRIQNVYMTFGGTSWGWLPSPLVYTSYDYGAAIDEARNITSKLAPMKQIGYFLESVPEIATAVPAAPVSSSSAEVKTYHLNSPGTNTDFFFVRSDSRTAKARFSIPITTADGSFTVPADGAIGLDGVDMKVFLAHHSIGTSRLVYSTSELMTQAEDVDGSDLALLHTRDGQDGETMLRYAGAAEQPVVTTLSGAAPTTVWDQATGDLRLNYTGSGLSVVRVEGDGARRPLLLLLAAEKVARGFWRLDTPSGPVIVQGPHLLRSARRAESRLTLTGDTKAAVPLVIWAGAGGVRDVRWNGAKLPVTRRADGALAGTTDLAGAPQITLPALTGWVAKQESPEADADFDDSGWLVADRTTSNSRTPVPVGQPVLFADDYGFHYGDVWYRGRYDAASSTVSLTYQTGQVGLLEAWLDGRYLGSHQMPIPTPAQSTQQAWSATATFAVPAELRAAGGRVLSVLIRPQGHEQNGGSNDAFRNARGLVGAAVTDDAGTAVDVTWRIQGMAGGQLPTVPVRGPLNAGGLYGERAGWSLPGYPRTGWGPVELPVADPRPGVTWYHNDVRLRLPERADASVGLTITDDPTKTYRALIFVNGWNVGQYVNDVGPQRTFVVPNGVLNPRGRNSIDIAVTSREPDGAASDGAPRAAAGGLGTVTLTDLGTVNGGVRVRPVPAPKYQAPSLGEPLALEARAAGETWSGPVATALVPSVAQGAVLAATIQWGDGTSSPGQVERSGDALTVIGTHTWVRPGRHRVTVQLADAYGSQLAGNGGREQPAGG